jgi:hypothetical protein
MSAAIDGPTRVQVVASWTGGHADLLRRSLRMTNESFAEHLGVAVRTVAYWRERPESIPKPAMQETLDAALERAPERGRAQFALLVEEAEHGKQTDRVDSREIPDPRTVVPGGSSPSVVHAVPQQRIPTDDIDDLLAHFMVTSVGEDRIQQIEQATIALAESHTQAPARKLLSQVMPLHERIRSLLGGRLRLSQQRELYRIESLLLSHACLLLGDLDDNALAERYGMAGLAFAREAGSDQAFAMTVLAKTFRWQKRLTESMDLARRGFACSAKNPDPCAAGQPGSERRSTAGRRGTCAGGPGQSRAGSGVRNIRFRTFGLVVPYHPASGLRAIRGDATRRCRRDVAGCIGGRCCVVGGIAEGLGELGANTRGRGDSACTEWVT